MAAVLALTCVPVILLSILSVSSAVSDASVTSLVTAALFVAVMFGATLGLFRWAQGVDNAEEAT